MHCSDAMKSASEERGDFACRVFCAPPLSDLTFDHSSVSKDTIPSIASDRHIVATLESDKVPTDSTTAFTPLELSEAQ